MKALYLQGGAFLEERETSRGLAEFWGKSCTRLVISSRQFLNCLNGARDAKVKQKASEKQSTIDSQDKDQSWTCRERSRGELERD